MFVTSHISTSPNCCSCERQLSRFGGAENVRLCSESCHKWNGILWSHRHRLLLRRSPPHQHNQHLSVLCKRIFTANNELHASGRPRQTYRGSHRVCIRLCDVLSRVHASIKVSKAIRSAWITQVQRSGYVLTLTLRTVGICGGHLKSNWRAGVSCS